MKKTTLVTVLFTVTTSLWVYLYSLTGISFDHAFLTVKIISLIKPSTFIFLLASGIALAGSITVIHYFSKKIDKNTLIFAVTLGILIPISLLLTRFTNLIIFILMMIFYYTGLLLLIFFTSPGKKKGVLKKLYYGWKLSRKVIYLLGVGGLLIGVLMTFSSLEKRQNQFKESTANITQLQIQSIDLDKLIEGTGEGGALNFTPSREETKETLLNSIKNKGRPMNYSTWMNLSKKNRSGIINRTYERTKNMTSDVNISSMIGNEKKEELKGQMTQTITEKLFTQVPIFKYLMKLLPVMAGVAIASFILLYGTLFVYPFCALMNLVLVEESQEEKIKQLEEKLEEREKEMKKSKNG